MSPRALLLPMLGNWTGTEQLSPVDGPVATARAMIVWKLDVADQVVLQDYRQVGAAGAERSGHGVFLLDRDSGDLCWWFFDSDGGPPTMARGRRMGEEVVLVALDGKRRTEHRFSVADEELTYRIVVTDEEQPTVSVLNGRYQRISGH